MCGNHPEYPLRTETVNHPLLPGITDTRIDKFFSGPYASQHLDKLLDLARYDDEQHVKLTYWSAPGDSKPTFDEGVAGLKKEGKQLKKGHKFGPSWTNHWVKVDLIIPEKIRGANQEVIFEFDPSSEGLFFTPDGTPLHALTGGQNTHRDGAVNLGIQEDRRVEHIIPAEAVKAGKYSLIIELSCNGMFGVGLGARYQVPEVNRMFPLVSADIVLPNLPVRALRTDFRILMQVARQPEAKTSGLAQRALRACDEIMNTFKRLDGDDSELSLLHGIVQQCREIAWGVLGSLDAKSLEKSLTRTRRNGDAKIWAIGHCHIDTAWLWRYTQTQQKVARSWTTQVDIMTRYPGHQFAASSAQQYLWLEQLYPKGFAAVKAQIEAGRFHPTGGAWLEHDCMIPSGESLCRQYLYGQRYFKSRFGRYCREAWLPDTFGYASQLPQILRLAGLNYFFTQKLSWNNINTFPYSSFNWSGIDGTQVLAHMTPIDSYLSQCNYEELVKGVRNNKNLGVTDQCLMLFGNGDGGGGPTPLMMEKLDRLSALADSHPEVPAIKMGSPSDFFDDLCAKTDSGRELPTWRGELYFEFHRGTYTTQANVKRGNRNMETLLRDLEYFATMASLKSSGYKYPKKELDEMWQDTLLGQFHDCLPGTTIKMVVNDNLDIYERRGKQARGLIEEALDALKESKTPTANGDLGAKISVIDPLRQARDEIVPLDGGKLGRLQTDANGIGHIEPSPQGLRAPKAEAKEGSYTISNARFNLTIANGRIVSLKDLSIDRELITPGPGTEDGGWMIHEDYPLQYDAWDVEIYHLKSFRTVKFDKVEVVEGPLRASLIATAKFGGSSLKLTISLDACADETSPSAYPKFAAEVDWHEKHKLLKFVLPVDIHAPSATYATQFGLVERPTHRNTTHDQAKFECCAHGFVDLSEANYGVAFVCRGKYGYSVEGNTMRISCLRSPTSPDPDADQGKHAFTFGVIPHRGQLAGSVVQAEAAKHNNAVHVTSSALSELPRFSVAGEHSQGIVLETIKRGENDTDSKRSVILRLFESTGGRARGSLTISGVKVAGASWVNILEEQMPGQEGECVVNNSKVGAEISMDFRCFEIKTLKLDLE